MLFFLVYLLIQALPVQAFTISKQSFCQTANVPDPAFKHRIVGSPSSQVLSLVSSTIRDFHITTPMVLHFTDEEGPRKVWGQFENNEKHIYFAKNAVDLLLGIEIRKVADEVCAPGWTGEKTFTINYTNTVVEQFLRATATRESMIKTLREKTGWILRSAPGDASYLTEQDFRTDELITLAKQLMDLPPHVLQRMKLKKVLRHRIATPMPIPDAKAIYVVEEQKILIGDGALLDDSVDVYGEGTIVHEMGHALWFGMNASATIEFARISWTKQGSDWVLRSDSGAGFVSDYAMSSASEDFAEHFSAFVHRPEFLQRKSPSKMEYFKRRIFQNTEYFTTVAANAKVRIDSPNPDKKDPWLLSDLKSSYEAKLDKGELVVEIKGAKDDLSGIAPTLLTLEHEVNKDIRIFVNLRPEPMADGSNLLRGRSVLDKNKLASGNYRPGIFNLVDMAGNNQFYKAKDLPFVAVTGLMALTKSAEKELDYSKIKVEHNDAINGYPGVRVVLPITHREDLDSVHLHWEFPELENKTTHVCFMSIERKIELRHQVPCYLEAKVGGEVRILSHFHKEYPKGKVRLASFSLHYRGSQKTTKENTNFTVPVNQQNAGLVLQTEQTKMNLLDLDVNKMKLSAVEELNNAGGDQNIELKIPLLRKEAGKFYIIATIRTPSGARINKIVEEQSPIKDFSTIVENGQEYIRYLVPLKKNPEDGEYLVEGFELKTKYPYHGRPSLPLDQGGLGVAKIKLLERGIRKTFTVRDQKIDLH